MTPPDAHALHAQLSRVEQELVALRQLAARLIPAEQRDTFAFEQQFPQEVIYHITPAAYYHAYPADKPYLPQPYEKDGFIHCTRGADLLVMVANRHYRSTPGDFLMLVLEVRALMAPLKYEAFDPVVPFAFPHLYGPLNREAISAVIKMPRAADGTFLAPPFSS